MTLRAAGVSLTVAAVITAVNVEGEGGDLAAAANGTRPRDVRRRSPRCWPARLLDAVRARRCLHQADGPLERAHGIILSPKVNAR